MGAGSFIRDRTGIEPPTANALSNSHVPSNLLVKIRNIDTRTYIFICNATQMSSEKKGKMHTLISC